MKKLMITNQQGVSLVGVLMASSLIGVVALALMNLMSNMNDGQSRVKDTESLISLTHEIRSLLHNKDYCRVSLAGDGPSGNPNTPVVIEKKDIDDINSSGLPVELWTSDQTKNQRQTRKFFADQMYDKIRIKNIQLYLPNGVPDTNYASDPGHTDQGYLQVTIERKMGKNKREEILNPPNGFLIDVSMKTDASGQTTILDCGSVSENGKGLECWSFFRLESMTVTGFVTPTGISETYDGKIHTDFVTYETTKDHFGITCREDKGLIFTGCAHSSDGDDSDTQLTTNGCSAGRNDADGKKNRLYARCCRMKSEI